MKQFFTFCHAGKRPLLFASLSILLLTAGFKQVCGQTLYNYNGVSGLYTEDSSVNLSSSTNLITVGSAAISATPCAYGFTANGFPGDNSFISAVEVDMYPNTGDTFNITGFSANLSSSVGGPDSVELVYSPDGGTTYYYGGMYYLPSSGCDSTTTISWTTSFSVAYANYLIVDIFGFYADLTGGNLQVLNLSINGTPSGFVDTVTTSTDTGTLVPGTAWASSGMGCPASTITLSDTGYSVSGSISFQWQSSADGITWTNIDSATTASYTFTPSGAAYYQCVVSFTATGAAASSNTVWVGFESSCSCTPEYYYTYYYSGYGYGSYYAMSSFNLAGYDSSGISDAPGASSTGYWDRTGAVAAVNLEQAGSYSGSLYTNYYYYYYEGQVWIDFNDDGTFESSEAVTGVFGSLYSYTNVDNFTVSIPETAATGIHRMRVRSAMVWSGTLSPEMDPCNYYDGTDYYYYGNTYDYLADIVALPICSGTPVAGTASASTGMGCSTSTITLNDAGYTIAGSIGFQWQSSTDGITWTNIDSATTSSYTFTPSAASWYQCVVSCTAIGASSSSNTVWVGFESSCPCTPEYYYTYYYSGYGYGAYYAMSAFDLTGYSGSSISDAPGASPTGYWDRTTAVAAVNLEQAGSYSGSLYTNYYYYYYEGQVWIDFDDDGTFESSEAVTGVFGSLYSYTDSDNFTVSIPVSAATGTHRMRVRNALVWSGTLSPEMDPCNYYDGTDYYYYGNTYDYLAHIVALPACSGAPVAGTASASTGMGCSASTITLSDTGYTILGSIGFQWQSSPDGATWTNIAGAITASYSFTPSGASYYQCVVSCTATGASSSSNTVWVGFESSCPCTPEYYYTYYYSGYGYGSYYSMSAFDLTGYSGSSISDAPGASPTGYWDRTTAVAAVNLEQAGSYSGNLYTNYYYYYYEGQIWIDFDDDGTFESSEAVTDVFGSLYSYTDVDNFMVSIPETAATGTHRMRVRNALVWSGTLSPEMDPCNYYDGTDYYYYGNTYDYLANIIALPACSGAPVAGTASASTGMGCSTSTITLSDTGYTILGSIGFQWQSSPDGATWTNIAGATTSSYGFTPSGASYYQCVVSCMATGDASSSNTVWVGFESSCPCTPEYYYTYYYSGYGYGSYYAMSAFNLTGYSGSSISDAPGASPTGYWDRTTAVAAVNLEQVGSYSGNLYTNYYYYYYEGQIWIDFDDDGTFESSEAVTDVFGSLYSYTDVDNFTVSIPETAAIGTHRMRVRNALVWSGTLSPEMDPCNYHDGTDYYYYGNTYDYLANIVALPACSGAPVAGTASASSGMGCSTSTITVRDTGYTISGGIGFQWQSSSDGTTWTNIAGATTSSYSFTPSAASYYQCVVSCTATGASSSSNTVWVGFESSCPCTPEYYYTYYYSGYGYGSYYAMSAFDLTGYSGSSISDAPGASPTGYWDRTTAVAAVNLEQAGSYSGSLYTNYYYYYYEGQIWIDFDDDGTFESSEAVTGVFGSLYSYTDVDNFTVSIPETAATGTHRMRVRNALVWSGTLSPEMDPCNFYDGTDYYFYGNTYDYLANIVALPACSGAPVSGTASASTGMGCSTSTVTLSDTGYTILGSIGFQWQSSPDGTTWTNITGATTSSYAFTPSGASWYQCVVSCTATGDASSSNTVWVGFESSCPCTPEYYYTYYYSGYGYGSYYAMSAFNLSGYSGSSISDAPGASPTGYWDRTAAVAAVNLQQAGSYSGSLYTNYYYYYYEGQIWIDFNDDGTFESSEAVTDVFGSLYSYTDSNSFTVSIPETATGNHRMRVRNALVWSGTLSPEMDPCNFYDGTDYYYYGNTYDYLANIVALPACSGAPVAGTASASSGMACSTSTVTLSETGYTILGSIGLQWQSSPDGTTWTNIAGATTPSFTFTPSAASYYQCVVSCTATGDASSSNTVWVGHESSCPCTPEYYYTYYYSGDGYGAYNAMSSFNLSGYSGSSISDAPGASPTGYWDRTAAVAAVNLEQANSYSGNLYTNTYYYYYEGQIWIDFNDDGTFESSEAVTDVFGSLYSYTDSDSFTVSIPFSAAAGTHLMRVRNALTYSVTLSPEMDPCNFYDGTVYYYFGNTYDYLANIVALPVCSGAPVAGTASANTGMACSASGLTLNETGYTLATDISFQWQSSIDSITWTTIDSATTASYSFTPSGASYYQCVVSCTATGDVSSSNVVWVGYESSCPCTPEYYYPYVYAWAYSTDYSLSSFYLTGFDGSNISDAPGASATGYWDRTAAVPPVYMRQGDSYAGYLYTTTYYYYYEGQAWVDFDDDGTFESSEAVTGVFGSAYSYTDSNDFTIYIPDTATIGVHRMRVRNAMVWSGTLSSAMDPCAYYDATDYYYTGNTFDYLADIISISDSTIRRANPATVSNVGTTDITVYPNPTEATFNVKVSAQSHNVSVVIVDISGNVVENRIVSNNTGAPILFDLSSVARGIYLIDVTADDQTYKTKIILR